MGTRCIGMRGGSGVTEGSGGSKVRVHQGDAAATHGIICAGVGKPKNRRSRCNTACDCSGITIKYQTAVCLRKSGTGIKNKVAVDGERTTRNIQHAAVCHRNQSVAPARWSYRKGRTAGNVQPAIERKGNTAVI